MYCRILLIFLTLSFFEALAEEPSQRDIGFASMTALAQPLALSQSSDLRFLQSDLAKTELNLTDDQLRKVDELTNSITPKSLAKEVGLSIDEIGRQRIKGGDIDDKLMDAAKRIQKKMGIQSHSLLDEKQKLRLRQIRVQKFLLLGRAAPSLDKDLATEFGAQIRDEKKELEREIRMMRMRFYWKTFTKVFDDADLHLRGSPMGEFKQANEEKGLGTSSSRSRRRERER